MSNLVYLTKSDYKIAKTCAAKLYYKKLKYPTTGQGGNYTRMLADGGFIIGKMARLLYPDGIEIIVEGEVEQSIEQTKEALKKEKITLFEPVIYANNKLVRVDILVKEGSVIQLIEVKSKSFDSAENAELIRSRGINIFRSKKDGKVNSTWRSYIEDVAYQTYVLREMLQDASISAEVYPYLLMPDRTKTTDIENLALFFSIRETKSQLLTSKFNCIEVDFSGDMKLLRENHILTEIGIKEEVNELMPSVIQNTKFYLRSLIGGLKKIEVSINKSCKNCEFRGDERDPRDGFKECWGDLADVEPHILDLYHVGRIGGSDGPVLKELIEQKKVSLYDLPLDRLDEGSYQERQLTQIEHTQKNTEWISDRFPHLLAKFKYPLHFIDFETSRMAIPYHTGMRPFEQVAFQWSCHTINEPGGEPVHSDWINANHVFPNFEFAEALMHQIGESGTIFTWATHENSVLRDIYFQMMNYGYENDALKLWLGRTAKLYNHGKARLVDMNDLTLKHYFHPLMKGRTSLKCVLPAIWTTNKYLYEISWLAEYFQEEDSNVLSPYETLAGIAIADKSEVIKEGTGAMLAYQEMLYGKHKNDPEIKAKWQELLRQYCRLDTLAMVVIWMHWQHLVSRHKLV